MEREGGLGQEGAKCCGLAYVNSLHLPDMSQPFCHKIVTSAPDLYSMKIRVLRAAAKIRDPEQETRQSCSFQN